MGAFGSKFGLGDIPDLMGKVAVVTGVGRGYGLQIAKTLLSKGAIVIITDYSMDELMISVNDIKANNLGTKLKGFVLVPSSIESINKFIASLAKEYQAIDILISNAHTTAVELEKTTDGLEFTMGTNLIGSAYMITQMIPLLGGAKSGRIVVMCSGDIIDVSKGMYEDRLADIGGEKMVKIDNTDALFEESMLMLSMYVAQLADELAATNIKAITVHPTDDTLDVFCQFGFDNEGPSYNVLTPIYCATAASINTQEYGTMINCDADMSFYAPAEFVTPASCKTVFDETNKVVHKKTGRSFSVRGRSGSWLTSFFSNK